MNQDVLISVILPIDIVNHNNAKLSMNKEI